MTDPLPYRISVLCYLFDGDGRILLIHRCKPPNLHLYSPIGGKLDQTTGESPTACAIREIHEEAGVMLQAPDLRLAGLVSETAYLGEAHWLMFLYDVVRPVSVPERDFREGRLEWHELDTVSALAIPQTDRHVIWPLYLKYREQFFMAHIDCHEESLEWRIEQPTEDAGETGVVKMISPG